MAEKEATADLAEGSSHGGDQILNQGGGGGGGGKGEAQRSGEKEGFANGFPALRPQNDELAEAMPFSGEEGYNTKIAFEWLLFSP